MTTTTPAAESEHVELRGITFSYSDQGAGPVVLSAHGLSLSRAGNRALGLADFAEVARAGRRLISYDARGHGETPGTPHEEHYTWASLAEDMIALADHFSPDAPVSAIGSSMGTGTLLHAVTQRPQKFDRLVLTAPPTAWQTRAGQAGMYRTMADLVETSDPETLAAMMSQAPIPPIFQGLPGYPPAPDIQNDLMPTVFRGAGLADLPPLETIAGITQPTLILAWASDPGHPVSTAEKLHAAIAGSELHVSETQEDLFTWGGRAAEFLTR
ncbi:alpha/beta fold hydrolase [Subtercola endophyticus]|uniref:alpha/beta fold hydrolase n=1 Tax=Subtercola endophyticus TaxID=2895559 RepID=UPI001E4FC831|nr:alpha/beta fold hydrolase [Subtercola endophyticus]UFS59662.1 alpha/beta hydrolase [Subtercola endophyticus]